MRPAPSRRLALLLGAALLLPALVRAASPAKPPFEDDIEAFEAADRAVPPRPGAVLFVGSSSIRFWTTLDRDFPGLPALNRGFGGSTIADNARYADRIVIPYRPKEIVFYAGDNDVAEGLAPEKILSDFKSFVAEVRAALPGVPIVFLSIKPSLARWKLVGRIRETNALIRAYALEDGRIDYLDVFTPMLGPDGRPRKELFRADGLHMNERGYRLWTRLLGPRLQ
ncbi:MAG TPA: SGNH/GDSL hydrolase family protein [Elusimicrobiota bacterium]|jgi:lysophospholipase L1-like esterase|nr:SGNH/GDSL hydrolase family protein [Elusimicrobiota bacterium]